MRAPVRDRWLDFTEPLEGGVPWLYLDVRSLVTVAYGNLVDPLSAALHLPFLRPDGSPASQEEITDAWLAVKGDPRAAKLGHTYARHLSTIRLSREGMGLVARNKLDANDGVLRRRVLGWEDHNACVQMAVHSLAWACGPNAHFPRLFSALAIGDYSAAEREIHMNERTPEGGFNAGLRPRNVLNKRLIRNGARVRDYHLDPDTLVWDREIDVHEEPTQPALEPGTKVRVDPDIYFGRDDDE